MNTILVLLMMLTVGAPPPAWAMGCTALDPAARANRARAGRVDARARYRRSVTVELGHVPRVTVIESPASFLVKYELRDSANRVLSSLTIDRRATDDQLHLTRVDTAPDVRERGFSTYLIGEVLAARPAVRSVHLRLIDANYDEFVRHLRGRHPRARALSRTFTLRSLANYGFTRIDPESIDLLPAAVSVVVTRSNPRPRD